MSALKLCNTLHNAKEFFKRLKLLKLIDDKKTLIIISSHQFPLTPTLTHTTISIYFAIVTDENKDTPLLVWGLCTKNFNFTKSFSDSADAKYGCGQYGKREKGEGLGNKVYEDLCVAFNITGWIILMKVIFFPGFLLSFI